MIDKGGHFGFVNNVGPFVEALEKAIRAPPAAPMSEEKEGDAQAASGAASPLPTTHETPFVIYAKSTPQTQPRTKRGRFARPPKTEEKLTGRKRARGEVVGGVIAHRLGSSDDELKEDEEVLHWVGLDLGDRGDSKKTRRDEVFHEAHMPGGHSFLNDL